jgi:hypothetical protein
MERTQIYLNAEQRRFLESMAFYLSQKSKTRVTMSELIRRAVDDMQKKHGNFQSETDLIIHNSLIMKDLKKAKEEEEFLEYDDVFGD